MTREISLWECWDQGGKVEAPKGSGLPCSLKTLLINPEALQEFGLFNE